jgi:hypothetical protein
MWWWLLIWVCLLLVAGLYLGTRGWALWGQAKELASELAAAQLRLDDVQGELELLGKWIGPPTELAVFAGPVETRRQRDVARAAIRAARHRRRQASLPAWAKHVD